MVEIGQGPVLRGRRTMTHIRMMLATASLFLVSGAIDAARADDNRVTLYTSLLRGDGFNCNAVNVSHKTLQIRLALYDGNGHLISPDQGNPATVAVPAGTAAVFPTIHPPADQSPDEGYCKFEVFGTNDPNAVRADLSIVLTRTFGSNNDIPVLVFRTVEGH
jgi:hypothetical protein